MIKRWILGLDFVQKAFGDALDAEKKRTLDEERPKIFALAQKDMLEGFDGDVEKRAKELAKEELAKLLSIVDERMIISFSDTQKAIYIGGERITDTGQLQSLKAEAEALIRMDVWKLINETPKRLAHKAMFEDGGELPNQLLKGRAILYTLDTQKRILDTLKSYNPPLSTPKTNSTMP